MERGLKAYGAVLRLVRSLPKDTRPYYAKYARENFVNYRDVDSNDPNALDDLFKRAYVHASWVLNKVLSLSLSLYLRIPFVALTLLFLALAVFGGPIICGEAEGDLLQLMAALPDRSCA
ncbi:hypothetical protein HHK36_008329 [Tetracentron sinense]|uniref:Complex 1 LYR protein domain-containing protein n=1 Tax=Tetracentron sinense TaxID=13715 RepID=A0A834ZF96_TETSI|nr:hypothetical protein HHK36_008329 [Tetracentron sinense]